jgi:hypothetical protein
MLSRDIAARSGEYGTHRQSHSAKNICATWSFIGGAPFVFSGAPFLSFGNLPRPVANLLGSKKGDLVKWHCI